MLFDLRSRGRRRTVRIVYALLALVMVVGLVGLGVGTGSSGGILNAGENGSGSGGGNGTADQALKQALTAVKKHPTAANWANLLQARWSEAKNGSNFNSTSGYTAAGKKQLQLGADAWQSYLKLAPAQSTLEFQGSATLAADIYQSLSQFGNEATVWNMLAQATGGERALLCLAYSAYAAKQTSKGNLAAAKVVPLLPKAQQLTEKSTLKSASTSTSTAESSLATNC